MRPINASDAHNATKHERNWETAREAVSPSGSRKARPVLLANKTTSWVNRKSKGRAKALDQAGTVSAQSGRSAGDPELLREVTVHS